MPWAFDGKLNCLIDQYIDDGKVVPIPETAFNFNFDLYFDTSGDFAFISDGVELMDTMNLTVTINGKKYYLIKKGDNSVVWKEA